MKLDVALPLEPPVFSGVVQGTVTINEASLSLQIAAALAIPVVPPLTPSQVAAITANLLATINDAIIEAVTPATGIPYRGPMIVAENR